MKRIFDLCLFLTILTTTFNGCRSFSECKEIQQSEVLILIDVSDPRLFNEIDQDLTSNFPGFMERNGLGSVSQCQRFTLSMAHLSGKDELDLTSASISISRRGLSIMEQRKQASPLPLVNLMRKKLAEFRNLSKDPEMTKGSNISEVLLKSIIHSNLVGKSLILVFSDMVENNQALNLYKRIPSANEMSSVTEKMIDPTLLQQFKSHQEEGLDAQIIVVLKSEPDGKVRKREIKEFWAEFFKELKLDGQVQFIDNLTNSVEL